MTSQHMDKTAMDRRSVMFVRGGIDENISGDRVNHAVTFYYTTPHHTTPHNTAVHYTTPQHTALNHTTLFK